MDVVARNDSNCAIVIIALAIHSHTYMHANGMASSSTAGDLTEALVFLVHVAKPQSCMLSVDIGLSVATLTTARRAHIRHYTFP